MHSVTPSPPGVGVLVHQIRNGRYGPLLVERALDQLALRMVSQGRLRDKLVTGSFVNADNLNAAKEIQIQSFPCLEPEGEIII